MASLRHTHTYARMVGRKKKYFKCNDPKCSHFAHYDLVLGKVSKCNDCGAEFTLSRESLRRAKPKCLKCSDTKQARQYKTASTLVGGLLDKLEQPEEPKKDDTLL